MGLIDTSKLKMRDLGCKKKISREMHGDTKKAENKEEKIKGHRG